MSYDYAYAKRWRIDRDRGILRTIPAARVVSHLHTLLGAGWSRSAIAGAAGVSTGAVGQLLLGRQQRVTARVAAAILTVSPDDLPCTPSRGKSEPFVPRVGTVRRLQALMFMGYSHRDLTGHGIDSRNLLAQAGLWVTRRRHDQVAAFYDTHAMTPGPSPRAARYARDHGYVGPLAWDDIDHDPAPATDPTHTSDDQVDEVTVLRILAGEWRLPSTPAERVEVCRRFPGSTTALAELTGWKVERYYRAAARDVA